jgi:hypothetical protein
MQVIKEKKIPSYVPEFVRMGLGLALLMMYDGRVYDDFPGRCLKCGSRNCEKQGTKKGLFAKLIMKDGFSDVLVYMQRHRCKDCGVWYTSNGPFYDGVLYGSPLVDLVLMLSMEDSSYGVERTLMNLGMQIGADAVLHYSRLLADRSKTFAPLVKGRGGGLYGINLLKIFFGVETVKELAEKLPVTSIESLSDETYLRKKGALKRFIDDLMNAESRRVVHRGINARDVVLKDGKPSFPDSFTLALSYLPGAEAYSTLICTPQPFNQILAEILFKALEGTSFNMTDGSHNYNGVKDRILDPVHRTRSELKHDANFRELRKEAKDSQKKVAEAKNDDEKKRAIEDRTKKRKEINEYARAKYQEVLKSTLEQVRMEHPELFDELGNNFTGSAITNNGMEGGNLRLKDLIKVAHQRSDTAAGRSLLAAFRDSVFTMRGGKVRESLASATGLFSFGRVMG